MKYQTGFIAGCFDLIHPGYVSALKEAKSVCNHLVVGLHSDPSIERPEKARPILSMEERTETLLALKHVDEIKPYNIEQDLLDILKSDDPKIDVRFLGDDYKCRVDYTGCELGIDIHFIPRGHGWSATLLREKIMDARPRKWSDSQVQGWFDCCYSPSSKTQDKTRRT